MIRIKRGHEPHCLAPIRAEQLMNLRALPIGPNSSQIPDKYKAVGQDLCATQHYKCCYCEITIQKSFNDVEHYRPKGSACRSPGCTDKHGYWWLAYTWSNLLFACPNCNRSGKNDKFPLAAGSVALSAESIPPGAELPLLLDPSSAINPVEHIIFSDVAVAKGGPKNWRAFPRGNSIYGLHTIDVCDLNRNDLLEVRGEYFHCVIKPQIDAILRELALNRAADLLVQFRRAIAMTHPRNQFAAFTYDAFRAAISDEELFAHGGVNWPEPRLACLD